MLLYYYSLYYFPKIHMYLFISSCKSKSIVIFRSWSTIILLTKALSIFQSSSSIPLYCSKSFTAPLLRPASQLITLICSSISLTFLLIMCIRHNIPLVLRQRYSFINLMTVWFSSALHHVTCIIWMGKNASNRSIAPM